MNALVPCDDRIEEIGPYRVLHPLSSRGSGETLLAANEAGERVVLKALGAADRTQSLLDPKIADEARGYARLSHANILKLVDLFSADGQFFVALEYVDGRSLDEVHDALADDSDVDGACWIYVASSIFAALAAAHEATDADGKPAPIIHQKVTPSHVQIAWDGTVKLGAFSMTDVVRVARAGVARAPTASSRYLAPEQKHKATVGPSTDVYSAMLIVRELLSGGADLRPGASARVSEVIRAGLEQDPARRLNSAVHARDVLRAAIDMAGARKRFAAALARLRLLDEPPVSRDVAPTRPCDVEAAATSAPKTVTPPVPESVPESAAPTDDTPTVVRPPTEEELRALSALAPKSVGPAPEPPPRASPPRPPPLPARARAQRPPAALAPPTIVELDVEPEPEPAPEAEKPEAPARRGPRALRAAFRLIRGALSSKESGQ
jgi:serine/threonine-protein kinase